MEDRCTGKRGFRFAHAPERGGPAQSPAPDEKRLSRRHEVVSWAISHHLCPWRKRHGPYPCQNRARPRGAADVYARAPDQGRPVHDHLRDGGLRRGERQLWCQNSPFPAGSAPSRNIACDGQGRPPPARGGRCPPADLVWRHAASLPGSGGSPAPGTHRRCGAGRKLVDNGENPLPARVRGCFPGDDDPFHSPVERVHALRPFGPGPLPGSGWVQRVHQAWVAAHRHPSGNSQQRQVHPGRDLRSGAV
jgi:hypothetical protein